MKFRMISRVGIVMSAVLAINTGTLAAPAAPTAAQVEATLGKKSLNTNDIAILKGYAASVVSSYQKMASNDPRLSSLDADQVQQQYGLIVRSKKRVQGKAGGTEIAGSLKSLQKLFAQADQKNGNTTFADAMGAAEDAIKGSKRPSKPGSKGSKPATSESTPVPDLMTFPEEEMAELEIVEDDASKPSKPNLITFPEENEAGAFEAKAVALRDEMIKTYAAAAKTEPLNIMALQRYLVALKQYYSLLSDKSIDASSNAGIKQIRDRQLTPLKNKMADDLLTLLTGGVFSQQLYVADIWHDASQNQLGNYKDFGDFNNAIEQLNTTLSVIELAYSTEFMKIVNESSNDEAKKVLAKEFIDCLSVLINSANNIAAFLSKIPQGSKKGEATEKTKLEFYLKILRVLDASITLSKELAGEALEKIDKKYRDNGVIANLISRGVGISFIFADSNFKKAAKVFNENRADNRDLATAAIKRLNDLIPKTTL